MCVCVGGGASLLQSWILTDGFRIVNIKFVKQQIKWLTIAYFRDVFNLQGPL